MVTISTDDVHTDNHLNRLTTFTISVLFFDMVVTGPNGTVAMSSANGLVGTEFTSWYWLQPRLGF